jgi:RNA polymerase sigma factor (sigma-70 family)
MGERAADSLVQLIQRLREAGGGSGIALLSDEDLIARFVQTRDQAAFEVLVWRHGEMVLSAARCRLGRTPDAEDAFQAAFLTLARKADTIRRRGALAGWLHQVVCRICLRMIQQRQSRQRREQSLNGHDAIDSKTQADGELTQQIDAEIERLPDRYRRVVVLCYLQGRTTEEAAGVLGCPRGTVLSRLSAARQMLQRRLEGRGVAPAAIGAFVAASEAASGELNAGIVRLGLEAGAGEVGPRIVSLASGVIQTMLWNKLRMPIALVLMVCACVAGAGIVMAGKPDEKKADPPAKRKPENPRADPEAAKLESLLKGRRDNLKKGYEMISERKDLQALPSTLHQLLEYQEKILEVEIELSRTSQQRFAAYEQVLKEARRIANNIEDRVKAGVGEPHDLHRAKDLVLKIEIAIQKEKMFGEG